MPSTALMPIPKQQYFTANGAPLAGGVVYTYAAGTNNPKATYTDAAGTIAQQNPIPLNARGEPASPIYWSGAYKVELRDALGNVVYTVDNYNTDPQGLLQFFTSIGASLIGFIAAGAGAVARFIQDKLRERVSLLDFMTAQQRADVISHTGNIDVTAAVQAALDYIGGLPGGGRVYGPAGLYLVSATLNIKANTYLYGDGWFATMFKCTQAGDFLKSTFAINGSSAANINVKDLGAYTTNGASTGGGYVDVGGTYINVENCLFQGFKFDVILDQSELVVVDRCYMLSWGRAGIWIVNGPDHTPGANKGFTNRITITNNQFNGAVGNCILDDGGGNHLISGNNFNTSGTQILAAGCGSLSIINNEFEGAAAYPIYFSETTSGGVYVGGPVGFHVQGNGLGGGQVSIYMEAAHGGEITGNVVYQYSVCAFEYGFGPNERVTNVNIGSNYKALVDGSGRTDKPFFSDPSHKAFLESTGRVDQLGQTYSNQAPAPGLTVTTPISMEDITEGCLLRVMNADGTNTETVQASNITANTYTATYATSKNPGFLIFVMREQNAGTFTPTPYGSAIAGAFTTTACKMVWEKRDGRLHFNAQISWTATTSTGQMTLPLPFKAKNNGVNGVLPACLTGPGAIGAGVGQVWFAPSTGNAYATMIYLNTATGAIGALACPASGELFVNGSYEVA